LTSVTVLGGGPAGLAAALELAEMGVDVTLFEQQSHVGGNAASFDFSGINVDYGSHRLHPASHPQVLKRIRSLLGDELLTRPRHGRILLMGRWIHFPLRPADLLLRMHPRFSAGVALDIISKALPSPADTGRTETFSSILQQGLGKTICREFYFPYARKIWGVEPEALSPVQAVKRVSAGSIGKLIQRLLPSSKSSGGASTKGIYYYPRHGFGQISRTLHDAAVAAGARVFLGTRVEGISLRGDKPLVKVVNGNDRQSIECNQVYSTIPITLLTKLVDVPVPESVQKAADALGFRSMVLIYLLLDQDRFSEYDAHYFPGEEIPFTRISETRNYTDLKEPTGRTVLCVEQPCFQNEDIWLMSDAELGKHVCAGLARAGLPVKTSILEIRSRRLLSFGRQGLYVHDNTHHAIYMAQAAARSLRDDGSIDPVVWREQREIFSTHVVED
jgi:protoporphyrinogen oxidase